MSLVTVAGASGRLGIPVTRLLLAKGHRVRALMRDLGSPAAGRLRALGADVVRSDYDDPDTLAAAARGADAVVGAGTAHRAGPQGEIRHGLNLAEAAAAARIPQLVYISGAGADRPTGVPVFESKRTVEQRIRALGLPATILAPAYFMENAFNPWNAPALHRQRYPLALSEDRPLQQIAIDDAAAMAVLAVERPQQLIGQRIELASDELTGAEAAEQLSRVTGRTFVYELLPLDTLAPPLRILFGWLDRVGFSIDVAALRVSYPELPWRRFELWAASQTWPSADEPARALCI